MRPRHLIIPATVGVLAAGLLGAGAASAHRATVTPTCEGLTITATAYDGPPTHNSIVVTANGHQILNIPSFGTTYTHTIPWDHTQKHQWRVVINAPGTQYDHDLTGDQAACNPTTTTTPPTNPPTTTSPPTTPPSTTAATTSSTSTPATTSPPPPTASTDAPPTSTVLQQSPPPAVATSTAPAPPTAAPAPAAPAPATSPTNTPTAPTAVALPATGNHTLTQALIAASALAAGIALVVTARRRNQETHRAV